MIDRAFCVTMARYNAWQNRQLKEALDALAPEELLRERGAFFGTIQKTLSHLLWGDAIWMSRFDGGDKPDGGIPESTGLAPSYTEWLRARDAMDTRIGRWASQVDDPALQGDLTWYSGAAGQVVTRPMALCVVHMFNHQTHHRGQIHSMITAAGGQAPVSDLFMMPEE